MSNPNEAIAVFGGTFDPPHVGHLLVLAYVRAVGAVDRVLMVPAFEHPFGKQPAAGFEDRVRMCELTAAIVDGVRVSRIEQELGGTSRTLRTLEELARRHPGARLRLVVGTDVLPETPKWHRWDRIVELAPPLVVGRTGYGDPAAAPIQIPDVSSTELRRRLARDRGTAGLLSAAVERHIAEHDLYRTEDET